MSERVWIDMSGSGELEGELIYLHPSGLSKARRRIFESWILKEGGRVVADQKEGLVVVVEDKLLEGATLEAAIQKLDSEVSVVGLSWLSSCIEQGKRVSEVPFLLRRMSTAGKGQKKRRVHDLSSSDESEPEEGGSRGRLKHSLSDSDEDDTGKTGTVEKSSLSDDTGNTSGHGKRSSGWQPNANIAAELGKQQQQLKFKSWLLQLRLKHRTNCSSSSVGKLAKAYTASGDQWRARTYSRAVKTISALDTPITTR